MTVQSATKATPGELGQVERWRSLRSFASTSCGELAYHDIGAGPPVLMIHGFPLNAYQWRGVIELLRGERRCIAPDLLGLGHTRPTRDADLTMTGQARALVELLDALAIRKVDVIANDSGTGVAQILAGYYPERVLSLLLTNGDVEPDCPPEPLIPIIDLARNGGFARTMIAGALSDLAVARSGQGIIGLTYAEPTEVADETIRMYFAPLVASPERSDLTDAYAVSLASNPLDGIGERLRVADPPTAIVWGMADIFFKATDVDYLIETVPHVRYVDRIEAAKLFFPEEQPERIVRAARTLWSAQQ